jgi:hypothetical protein
MGFEKEARRERIEDTRRMGFRFSHRGSSDPLLKHRDVRSFSDSFGIHRHP